MKTAHTPTPWELSSNNDPEYLDIESSGTRICTIPIDAFGLGYDPGNLIDGEPDTEEREIRERKANAEFIVRAVNNHDPLMKALDELLTYMDGYEDDYNHKQPLPAFEKARKALENAQLPR